MTRPRRNPAVDLFGEVPVTQDEIRAWVALNSPVHLVARHFDNYVTRYGVADKIRAAKLAGTFDATSVGAPGSCPCGSGLRRLLP